MSKSIITFAILIAGLVVPNRAASSSSACIWMNDQQKWQCTSQQDPNGNIAAGFAGANGDKGVIAAGAGSPDYFNPNYQQIGFEQGNDEIPPNSGNIDGFGQGNEGILPNFGFGQNEANGMAAGSSSGYPRNFGPFIPQGNWNPFDFVQNFMRGRKRR